MKRILGFFLVLALVMSSSAVFAKDFVLTDTKTNAKLGNWNVSSKAFPSAKTPFSVEQKILHGGKQEGTEVITITSGTFSIAISPTRGMGILYVMEGDTRIGWNSPVDEWVNPAYMNLEGRGGAGWLEGFNEMVVRCGYEWSGHAVEANNMVYTLHGRAQNTPASFVSVNIEDQAPYTITVSGLVKENTFKQGNLEIMTQLIYVPGQTSFKLHDVLVNKADYADDYQIIYHSNFGTPILEEGAKFSAPVNEISPFNDYAKAGMDTWDTYLGPTKDFDEMVLNVVPYGDANGETIAMLSNKAGNLGVSITFNIKELPVLSLWKNTDTLKQGYVTGLEPGSCFAYPLTKSKTQGRILQLQPGESTEFNLTYSFMTSKPAVDAMQKRIDDIQGQHKAPKVLKTPISK